MLSNKNRKIIRECVSRLVEYYTLNDPYESPLFDNEPGTIGEIYKKFRVEAPNKFTLYLFDFLVDNGYKKMRVCSDYYTIEYNDDDEEYCRDECYLHDALVYDDPLPTTDEEDDIWCSRWKLVDDKIGFLCYETFNEYIYHNVKYGKYNANAITEHALEVFHQKTYDYSDEDFKHFIESIGLKYLGFIDHDTHKGKKYYIFEV